MKIADSNVTMSSNRQYLQIGQKSGSLATGADSFQNIASTMYGATYSSTTAGNSDGLTYGRNGIQLSSPISFSTIKSLLPSPLQKDLAAQLIRRMMGSTLSGSMSGGGFRNDFLSVPFTTATMTQREVTYEEYENTGFHAYGKATTEDGRTIDFNIDVVMSRSYMEYMDIQTPIMENMLTDPLVINMGADVANISDQTFLFDLDGDGTKKEISMLGRGSGFLALDLNEDGVINDGNELFGTKSGDGFGDLRKYDRDGNGWIDENDEVFSKLKVWCKGEHGEDILMDLKAADIGAIYLGEQATEFTLNGETGIRNGVIRSTGVFLRESGSAGTIQHVDLAVHTDQKESIAGEQPISYTENRRSESKQNRADNRRNEAARRKEREARRLKKKEQQKVLDEKSAKRRAEQKERNKLAEEKYQEHKEDLHERYEWLRLRQSYNLL